MRWLQQAFIIMGVLLAGSLQAGDLTLTATDNGDGTLTIGLDSFTDAPPVGIALMLDPNSSQLKVLHRGMPYYDIITTFDAGSNQITAFAALATLGQNDSFPARVSNLMTLDFGGPASGMIREDTLRGGMVDIQGMPLTGNLPLAFTVTGNSCTCYGDIANATSQLGADGQVDFGDINRMVSELSQNAFLISPVPAHLVCADVADDTALFGPDGIIDFGDINYLIEVLAPLNFASGCLNP